MPHTAMFKLDELFHIRPRPVVRVLLRNMQGHYRMYRQKRMTENSMTHRDHDKVSAFQTFLNVIILDSDDLKQNA